MDALGIDELMFGIGILLFLAAPRRRHSRGLGSAPQPFSSAATVDGRAD